MPGPQTTEEADWTQVGGAVEILVAPGRWIASVSALTEPASPPEQRIETRADRPALVLFRFPAR